MNFPYLRSNRRGVAACFAIVLAVCSCDEARRIPRIEPVLHLWKSPYVGFDGLQIHVFDTGVVRAPAALYQRGGSWFDMREVPVPAFVVEHPDKGLVVFDTGLSARVASDTVPYLGLLAPLDVVRAHPGQDLPSQMRAAGLDPERVSTVVLSHLHFDHTGSVEEFVGAHVVVAERELEAAHTAGWLDGALMRREDFDEVGDWDEVDYSQSGPFATFTGHRDLFGDGSIVLVDLAGHTAGNQGAIVMLADRPVLLTGDAAYVEANWRYGERPAMAHDMAAWWEVSWRIKKLTQLVPSTLILPGHDTTGIQRGAPGAVTFHAFDAGVAPAAQPTG